MDKQYAVYICTGCGIGDALDTEQLSKVATDEYSVPVCRTHAKLCGPEGARLIKDDIANEGANTIVVAACSPRVMYDVFDFDGCIVDRVNLREQVVWCQKPNDEDTQMMAEDYLRMSMAKVNQMQLPEPYKPEEDVSRDLLVVGGGLAGLTAALEGAKAGRKVVLVEKEKELGGFQKNVAQRVTVPYKEVKDNTIAELIQAVNRNDQIQVYTGAKVAKTAGGPGLFNVTVQQNGTSAEHRVGAVVLAAGWKPYNPKKLDKKLGFGASPDVVTNAMFEEMKKAGKIVRPSDGKEVRSVAFLQCAGQRDPKHLPYCSTICCLTALKQAVQVKEQNAEAGVFVIYKELRTPGQSEDFYRKAQQEGVTFVRCQDPEVKVSGATVSVEAKDELSGEDLLLENLDLVVLATGMVPMTAFGEELDLKEGEEGEEQAPEEDVPLDTIRKSDILNLEYRQGPELPDLRYGFPDSHFICFPYETRRTGIYAPVAFAVPWARPRLWRTATAPPSRPSSASSSPLRARRCIPGPGTCPSPNSSCSAAPSASDAPRNVPSGPSTKTRRPIPFRSPPAAVAAACAWGPVPSASFRSRTIPCP